MLVKLNDLFRNRKNCAGWIIKDNARKNRYLYQNCNDLGLLGEDLEEIPAIKCTKKIKLAPRFWVYELNDGSRDFPKGETVTKKQALALIKSCMRLELNNKEKAFVRAYWC